MALYVEETGGFRRDLKRSKKRGKDLHRLYAVVEQPAQGKPLAARHRPHPLKGEWVPAWECNIEPDWLLVYEVQTAQLVLLRTGTHSDLFS